MEDDEFKETIIEAIRDFREEVNVNLQNLRDGQKVTDRRLDNMSGRVDDMVKEMRATGLAIKGILNLLDSQQDIDNLHATRIDALESRMQKIEQDNRRTEH